MINSFQLIRSDSLSLAHQRREDTTIVNSLTLRLRAFAGGFFSDSLHTRFLAKASLVALTEKSQNGRKYKTCGNGEYVLDLIPLPKIKPTSS